MATTTQTPTTPDPFAATGGGVFMNGGWIPRDNPAAQGATATTPAATPTWSTTGQTMAWRPTNAPAFTAPTRQGATFTAPTMADLAVDTGYNFRLNEGQRLAQNNAAARGTLRGGAFMKDLTRYGQDMASQEYQNAFNRSLAGFNANQGERQQAYDASFKGAEATYAPQLQTWQAQNLAGQRAAELNFDRAWQKDVYERDDAYRQRESALNNAYRNRTYEGDDAYRRWTYTGDDAWRRDQIAEQRRQFLASLGNQ